MSTWIFDCLRVKSYMISLNSYIGCISFYFFFYKHLPFSGGTQHNRTHGTVLRQAFSWAWPASVVEPWVWYLQLCQAFPEWCHGLSGCCCPLVSCLSVSWFSRFPTQPNQCADYCTTTSSWTGSLNTGQAGRAAGPRGRGVKELYIYI